MTTLGLRCHSVSGSLLARAPPAQALDSNRVNYLKVPHILSHFRGLCVSWPPAWNECLLTIGGGQSILILQDSDQMSPPLGAFPVPRWLVLPPLCSLVSYSYLEFRTHHPDSR